MMPCCRQITSGTIPAGYEEYIPKNHPRLTAPMMPSSSSVYNFTFNKDRAEWQAWSDTLPSAAIPAGSDFSDIIVPTQDSARYTFLLDTALRHAQPVLFVGPTGQPPSPPMQLCHCRPSGSLQHALLYAGVHGVLQKRTHCSLPSGAVLVVSNVICTLTSLHVAVPSDASRASLLLLQVLGSQHTSTGIWCKACPRKAGHQSSSPSVHVPLHTWHKSRLVSLRLPVFL